MGGYSETTLLGIYPPTHQTITHPLTQLYTQIPTLSLYLFPSLCLSLYLFSLSPSFLTSCSSSGPNLPIRCGFAGDKSPLFSPGIYQIINQITFHFTWHQLTKCLLQLRWSVMTRVHQLSAQSSPRLSPGVRVQLMDVTGVNEGSLAS